MTYRVLVTGSRDWPDWEAVYRELEAVAVQAVARKESLTVVHGACPTGADAFAAQWARNWPGTTVTVVEETHPADWAQGRSAGPRRNAHMMSLGADMCLAFIRNNSQGASHTAGLARRAGIPVKEVRA